MAKIDETVDQPETDVAQTEEAARQAELALPAELAAESVGDYLRSSLARVKAGESGVLPVVAGLILISILFQSLDSKFLTAGNLVNLLVQAAVFILLAMGEVFVLLLGEIDLSVGFVAGIGGVIMADLASPAHGWPWWAAILAALLACAGVGLLQGTIITRIGLPSFVVTLAGLLFWQGVLLKILGNGGTIPIQDDTINDIASANLSPLAGWIVMLVLVAVFGLLLWRRDAKRRRAGLVAPPPTVTLLKIGGALAGGVALVLLCNHDRGIFAPIRGVPWVVLLVLGVLVVWTFLLGRTQLGRYLYAIGGNAEAARRAGVSLAQDPDDRVHAVQPHGRDRRHRLRVAAAVGLDLDRRRHARALRGRGRGDRRHEPVRRPRQGDPRRARRARDRGDRQRHGPEGLHGRVEVHGHGARAARRGDDRRALAARAGRSLTEARNVKPGVWHWQAPHPEWTAPEDWTQTDVSSYAIDDGQRLLLFDPLAVPADIESLASNREPLIVLTCPWHRRDAQALAEKHGWPIHVPPPGPARSGSGRGEGVRGRPAAPRRDRGILGMEPNDLLLWVGGHRALVAGDTLVDRGQGLVFPLDWADRGTGEPPEKILERLRDLLELPIELVLPTHGAPADRAALEHALASD